MAVRGLGYPVRFTLTAGQKGDAPQAAAMIEGLPAEGVMATRPMMAQLWLWLLFVVGAGLCLAPWPECRRSLFGC